LLKAGYLAFTAHAPQSKIKMAALLDEALDFALAKAGEPAPSLS